MERHQSRRRTRFWSVARRLLWIAGAMVAMFAGSLAAEIAGHYARIGQMQRLALGEVVILLVGAGCALLDRDGVRNLGLLGHWKDYDVAIITGTIVLHYAISFAASAALIASGKGSSMEGQQINQVFRSFTAYQAGPFLLMAAGLTLLVGLAEELLFRGYIISRLDKAGLPGWLCILLSAAIFAAVHVPGYGLLLALPKIGLGIMFAVYFWYRRNLGPLIISHFLIDFSGFVLAYLTGSLVK